MIKLKLILINYLKESIYQYGSDVNHGDYVAGETWTYSGEAIIEVGRDEGALNNHSILIDGADTVI